MLCRLVFIMATLDKDNSVLDKVGSITTTCYTGVITARGSDFVYGFESLVFEYLARNEHGVGPFSSGTLVGYRVGVL